ncbi:DUF3817 domain-containing protein, partial [bacterium]
MQKKGSKRATLIERVRLIGILEGVSSILLLIGMGLKYGANMPLASKVGGTVHGGMFVIYIVTVL